MSRPSTGVPHQHPDDQAVTDSDAIAEPLGDDPRPGNHGHAAEADPGEGLDDRLDQASDESFPASDPPSWSAAPTPGDERAAPSAEPPDDPSRHGLGRLTEQHRRR